MCICSQPTLQSLVILHRAVYMVCVGVWGVYVGCMLYKPSMGMVCIQDLHNIHRQYTTTHIQHAPQWLKHCQNCTMSPLHTQGVPIGCIMHNHTLGCLVEKRTCPFALAHKTLGKHNTPPVMMVMRMVMMSMMVLVMEMATGMMWMGTGMMWMGTRMLEIPHPSSLYKTQTSAQHHLACMVKRLACHTCVARRKGGDAGAPRRSSLLLALAYMLNACCSRPRRRRMARLMGMVGS